MKVQEALCAIVSSVILCGVVVDVQASDPQGARIEGVGKVGAPHVHALTDTGELGCASCAAMKRAFLAGAPVPPRLAVERAEALLAASDTDVLHYDLDIEIDPGTQNISGQNVITVESRLDGLTEFDVRLSDAFTVTDVRVNGLSASWVWVSAIELTVTLDQAYNTGQQFDVLIEYGGPAVAEGFGSISWSSDSLGSPFVYTLSETWFAYTWWPNKDDATDKATADMHFTFPDNLHLVSNGLLQSDTALPGNKRRLHYQTNYQTATYLFCFGLGNYNTWSGSHPHANGVMPLEFAVLATSDSQTVRDAWLRVEDMLPVFDGLFGTYPFIDEKYGIYHFGFGGGMEHQTMTGQGTLSESVTAHELGHQWWGDMVTCAVWNHIWLNEGFATYSETLWYEFEFGASDPAARIAAMQARTPSSVGDTVYVTDETDFNRIFDYNYTYLKGGWVLHMLRGVVGDQTFFDTLSTYRATYEGGAAVTDDFRAIAESESGLDLTSFFDQWIFLPGAPSYLTSFSNVSVNGQDYAEIYIEQVQSPLYPTFEMPVQMRLTTGAGTADATVQNDEPAEHMLVPIPAPASSLTLDPDLWILKTGAGTGSFVLGPPKIADASPAPGETLVVAAPTQLTATFHRDVVIDPSNVGLAGDSWGLIPHSFAYDVPSQTLTITPLVPLPPDTYRLTIDDAVVASGTLLPLDGEIINDSLPSGDGLASGAAEIVFAFVPPVVCVGDVDRDNDTDIFDFGTFATNFGATGVTRDEGDLDGNTDVDVLDFAILAADFGCAP